jgi:hypothetical protein
VPTEIQPPAIAHGLAEAQTLFSATLSAPQGHEARSYLQDPQTRTHP